MCVCVCVLSIWIPVHAYMWRPMAKGQPVARGAGGANGWTGERPAASLRATWPHRPCRHHSASPASFQRFGLASSNRQTSFVLPGFYLTDRIHLRLLCADSREFSRDRSWIFDMPFWLLMTCHKFTVISIELKCGSRRLISSVDSEATLFIINQLILSFWTSFNFYTIFTKYILTYK